MEGGEGRVGRKVEGRRGEGEGGVEDEGRDGGVGGGMEGLGGGMEGLEEGAWGWRRERGVGGFQCASHERQVPSIEIVFGCLQMSDTLPSPIV